MHVAHKDGRHHAAIRPTQGCSGMHASEKSEKQRRGTLLSFNNGMPSFLLAALCRETLPCFSLAAETDTLLSGKLTRGK